MCEVGKYLKELRQLTLDQTKVTDRGFVYVSRHLPKLVSLGIEGCKITDRGLIKAAESLANLEELDLGSNSITDAGIQQAVVYLKGLTDMTLTSCNAITDASIESVIKGLPCLTHLGIEGCFNISEEAVERLRETAKSAISFFWQFRFCIAIGVSTTTCYISVTSGMGFVEKKMTRLTRKMTHIVWHNCPTGRWGLASYRMEKSAACKNKLIKYW